MNLKEKLAAKRAELKGLEAKIQAGDAEAIKAGNTLMDEIEALQTQIKAAERAEKLLKDVGTPGKEGGDGKEDAWKGMHMEELKVARGSKSIEVFVRSKAATDPQTTIQIADTDRTIIDVPPLIGLRDIMGAEQISGNALTYLTLGTTEVPAGGAPAIVAEGAKKPQMHTPYTPHTVSLTKIAAFFKESDELLEDAPFLESALRARGIYLHQLEVEDYLAGVILGTSGIQAITTGISFDTLATAKAQVFSASRLRADAIVLNPTDYQTLLLAKDGNLQYLLGGPAYAPYGNGGYSDSVPIWGLRVIQSTGVSAGTALVGAFRTGSSVVTKRGSGLRVEVSNSNEDDFVKNLVTVRIEERLVGLVRQPSAFVKITT